MKTKHCKGCKRDKSLSLFRTHKEGYKISICKECEKARALERYYKNKEKNIKVQRDRRKKNKDLLAKGQLQRPDIKEQMCRMCKKVMSIENFKFEKQDNRYITNCAKCAYKKYQLAISLRSRTSRAISNKAHSTLELLGCTIEFLEKWILFNFSIDDDAQTLETYGKDSWHIDHVVPLCAFDLEDANMQKIACHWTNTRPLDAYKNIAKCGRIKHIDMIEHEIRLRDFVKNNKIDENFHSWKLAVKVATPSHCGKSLKL